MNLIRQIHPLLKTLQFLLKCGIIFTQELLSSPLLFYEAAPQVILSFPIRVEAMKYVTEVTGAQQVLTEALFLHKKP